MIRPLSYTKSLMLYMFLTTSVSSCEYKDLCYTHPHTVPVRIVYDWSQVPAADPAWMELWMYPKEGGTPFHFQLPGRDGGVVALPPGQYRCISYNGDSPQNHAEGVDDFYLLRLTTSQRAHLWTGESYALQPEPLYHASRTDIDLPLADVEHTVLLSPKEAVMDVTVEIRHVSNLRGKPLLMASLTGMSDGCCVGTGEESEGSTMLFSDVSMNDATTLQTHFQSFGHSPNGRGGQESDHTFTLYVRLDDGTTFAYQWNVTGKMHSEEQNPRHLYVLLDGLELPENIGNASGISPTLDGWMDEYIEVSQ